LSRRKAKEERRGVKGRRRREGGQERRRKEKKRGEERIRELEMRTEKDIRRSGEEERLNQTVLKE
jgi:hypothetical protein